MPLCGDLTQGRVFRVDIEVAEGVGEQMKQRAIEAGYLSLFPPDASRGEQGLTFRREFRFSPDQVRRDQLVFALEEST